MKATDEMDLIVDHVIQFAACTTMDGEDSRLVAPGHWKMVPSEIATVRVDHREAAAGRGWMRVPLMIKGEVLRTRFDPVALGPPLVVRPVDERGAFELEFGLKDSRSLDWHAPQGDGVRRLPSTYAAEARKQQGREIR